MCLKAVLYTKKMQKEVKKKQLMVWVGVEVEEVEEEMMAVQLQISNRTPKKLEQHD